MAKAYLIDSKYRMITEVEYDSVSDINKHIDCITFCLGHTNRATGDTLYVDDNGLYKIPQYFFFYQPRGEILAGNGLLVGREVEGPEYKNGYTTLPPLLTLMQLKRLVLWMESEPAKDTELE